MNNLKKKIVAVVTTMTLAAWLMPGSAFALTADELQAQINALMAQLATLQSQLTTIQGDTTGTVTCSITSFTTNLKQGDSGDAVKCLQVVLNSSADTQVAASGVGSSGNETMYFGPLTKSAVIKFQEKYASDILTPLGLTAGTGFVGSGTRAKLNTMLGTGGTVTPTPTPTPTPATGAATIMIASDTSETAQIAAYAQDAVFTKVKFYGGSAGVTITKIIVTRGGVSADTDISSIKLYDGTTQLGSTQALNTNTHKATFTGLSWNIPAGETKYLTIKGSIAALGTATVGDSIKLNLASADDITASAALEGTFPINGNAKTIAGISVGELFIATTTAPAAATLLSGATEQEIVGWTFQASSTEGVKINSIKVTHIGSATRDDIKNIKLKLDGIQIGSTVASLDSYNAANFDLSASPISILAGATKTIYAYADIASGIWTSRTIIFEITQYTDVVAYGANSGGQVLPAYSDTLSFLRAFGNTMTVGQGDVTVTVDASLNPAAQTYVKGTSQRLISAFKFSSGSREGIRVTEFKLTFSGTVTNIANITLWDGTTQIGGSASAIGSYVTFGANTVGWDTTGLFDVAKSSNKTIQVKADIPSGAANDATIELYVANATDVKVDGLDSQYDLASSAVTVTSAGQTSTNIHTIGATGSLTVAKSSLSAAAQSYVKGSTAKEFLKLNLTAGSGEDISVTSIVIHCYTDADAACASGTTTNVKLLKADGTQFGSTVASPSTQASFSGNLTVPASETVSLTLIADIPSTAGSGIIYWKQNGSAQMTATGIYSSADIIESGTAQGNNMTVGAGTLTIAAAATPGDQTLIIGATEVPFVGLVLTAGTAEDVRVTYVKLTTSASNDAEPGDVGNIALFDGSTRLTAKKNLTTSTDALNVNNVNKGNDHHTVTFAASDFLNSQGIDLVKGQQKTITVKADLLSTAIGGRAIALGVSSTDDLVVTGLASNSTISEGRDSLCSNCDGVNYDYVTSTAPYQVTIQSSGTLTMISNAGTPSTGILAVGEEGAGLSNVIFHKVDFTASRENIYIRTFEVGRLGGGDEDFSSISLWDGTTQLGSAQTLVNASTTFSLPAGSYWLLSKGVTKTLTIKANLNGVRTADGYGALTGDAPQLRLDNVTVQGVSSGSTSIVSGTGFNGNIQYIRQSKPTVASASLPSSVYGTGEKTLYRWTVTADSKGAIGWNKIVFDMSGGVTYHSLSNTVGCNTTCATTNDGVYMSTGTDISTQLIATSSMKVYDLTSNEQVTATTTGTAWTVANASGLAKVSFVPYQELVIAAGETRTYELRGTILQAGSTGDSLQTKLADGTTTATSTTYADVAGNTNVRFVWTDRSGAAGTHTGSTADWTTDYKVSGFPTATLSLSK